MALLSKKRIRVRFVADGQVDVRGRISEADRAKVRRLLAPLPIRQGEVEIREDWRGRVRIVFDKHIPDRYRQPIRNLLGNLPRL